MLKTAYLIQKEYVWVRQLRTRTLFDVANSA